MYNGKSHDVNETCLMRFNALEEKLEILEDKNEKRAENDRLIEKAIIEIQISSGLTAKTLAKLEEKFETFIGNINKTSGDNMYKLLEKGLYVLAGIIGALIGQKII
jgi:hypothetical protein